MGLTVLKGLNMKSTLLALALCGVTLTSFAQTSLTSEEKNVFVTIVNQDIEAMRHGEESIFFPKNGEHYASIVPTEALEGIYSRGEAKANEIFTNKWVILEGIVSDVHFFKERNQSSILFKTQRPNVSVIAQLDNPKAQEKNLTQVRQNELARLVCKSKGKVENELRFEECQVLSYFADQTQLRISKAIEDFSNGTTGDEHVDKLIAHVVVLTSLMNEEQLALCKDPIGVSQALKQVMVKYNRRSNQNPKAQARLKELSLVAK